MVGVDDPQVPTLAPPRTVVLVDDDEGLRTLYLHALDLDDEFAVVGQAVDGLDAVTVARAHQPDVVLLDMLMPVMDGLVALPLVREASPRSRVVVLSSLPGAQVVAAATAAGADGFVSKTQPLASLLADLRDAVRP